MSEPNKLRRYGELGALLLKYGRADFIEAVNADLEVGLDTLDSARVGGRGPDDLVEALTELGPTFVKLGQMLSTRGDLLSAPYREALASLQDDVAAVDFSVIEQVIEAELGVSPHTVFEKIDSTPLAAASLAQVHRATLRGGREVVVKVQRPNIKDQIVEDLEIVNEIARAVDRHTDLGRKYEFARIAEQFRSALLAELDYEQEAQNLNVIGGTMLDFENIVLPEPVTDLVTSKVLVMDYIDGQSVSSLGPLARMEADFEPLANDLCEAYLHQILVAGIFHSDPHPGNVLVLPDNRLALIDLGMVSHIETDLRSQLLRVLIALSAGNGRETAELALDLGELRESANRDRFIQQVGDLVTQRKHQPSLDRKLGNTLLKIVAIYAENGIRPPVEIGLLGKTLLLLDEVARMLDPEFDPDEVIDAYAQTVLQEQFLSYLSPGKAMGQLLDARRLADRFPRQIQSVLQSLSRGEMRFRVDALDENNLLTSLERIGNRIALGIVLAALIIGAALMMDVETPAQLFGYPALAIVLFLAAAVLGFGVVVHVIASERRDRRSSKK